MALMTMTLRKSKLILWIFFISSSTSTVVILYKIGSCSPDKSIRVDRGVTTDSDSTIILNVLEQNLSIIPSSINLDRNHAESVHAAKVLQELQGIQELSLDELAVSKIPNTVYYIWCPNRTLEFRQYLGLLSVWKTMRPDIIEFHHQYPLLIDNYNNWIEELETQIPGFVVMKPFKSVTDELECENNAIWRALSLINGKGGIYVATDILVTKEIVKFKRNSFSVFYSQRTSKGNPEVALMMGNAKDENLLNFRKTYVKSKAVNSEIICSNITMKLILTNSGMCHTMNTNIHPEDIWTLQNAFGNFTRQLLYGTSNTLTAKPILPGKIPKIVHYVWFGRKEMDFEMYLSMLSTLFIANAKNVYIHGDGGLYGAYFEKVKQDKRLKIIKHHEPRYIFGHNVRFIQHMSDIIRAEILLKFGGIYMDWDAVWLQDPQEIIDKGYDAVANYDHMQRSGFPNTLNLGVFMAKPRSTFVKRWQDAFSNYKSNDFLFNAVQLPYKIYEKYPEYLHIEKRLQVMCYNLKCHPVFHPEFKRFDRDQPFDWQTDVYAIHFTYPSPKEWKTQEICRNSYTGRFATIGRYILKHEDTLPMILADNITTLK